MAVAMQNRQRSALMMSNMHFLFVALPYINIKQLREGRGELAFDVQLSMVTLM